MSLLRKQKLATIAVMTAIEDPADVLARLAAIQTEYSVTVRVLAVVVEQLLLEVGGETIEISDEKLASSPKLRAWRDLKHNTVAITVEREAS